jgi:hypothetical protein
MRKYASGGRQVWNDFSVALMVFVYIILWILLLVFGFWFFLFCSGERIKIDKNLWTI